MMVTMIMVVRNWLLEKLGFKQYNSDNHSPTE